MEELAGIGRWFLANPVPTAILLLIAGLMVYAFGFLEVFVNHTMSTYAWAMRAWNPTGNQEHGRLVPLIALGLIWIHRDRIRAATIRGSNLGLIPLAVGIFFFLISVRCVQPRFAIMSVPFFFYGSILFVCGREVARVALFPSIFMFFMVPVAALERATFDLQFIITGLVGGLSKIFGIGIQAVGTTLTATDGAFNFEIAEGCSGIRSLAAMTMLTAAYVYLTQNRFWKQALIFICSVGFAIIGNVGRIFTVVLVAKYYDPEFASGLYHDYSGYVFFPIAVVAMLAFARLVNFRPAKKEAAA